MTATNLALSSPKVKSEVKPRHPYAFCQCEGEDCLECLREEIEDLRNQLDSVRTRWLLLGVPAMRELQVLREEVLELRESQRSRRLIPAHHVESLVEN